MKASGSPALLALANWREMSAIWAHALVYCGVRRPIMDNPVRLV